MAVIFNAKNVRTNVQSALVYSLIVAQNVQRIYSLRMAFVLTVLVTKRTTLFMGEFVEKSVGKGRNFQGR